MTCSGKASWTSTNLRLPCGMQEAAWVGWAPGVLRARASDIWLGGLRVLALVEDLRQVFPGMAAAGLEQRDGTVDGLGHHPRGKDAAALRLGARRQRLGAGLGGELEDTRNRLPPPPRLRRDRDQTVMGQSSVDVGRQAARDEGRWSWHRVAGDRHLSDHDLRQLDDAYLAGLSDTQARALLSKALADLKAARERLGQTPPTARGR